MFITKSKFLIGLECPRCFWKAMNEKNNDELSHQQDQIIKQGSQVGELAKSLFSNGIDLSKNNFNENLEATKDYLYLDYVIFEGGFKVDNLYARVDILVPNSDESYDIVEVKSSTKVEDRHIYDIAFQKYVCEKSGVSIKECHVLHINNSYIKDGDINLNELFIKENITNEVESIYAQIPMLIEELTNIYKKDEAPILEAKEYLLKKYPCNFDSECWSFLPKYNVSKLYKIKKNKAAELIKNDVVDIVSVPDEKLSSNQLVQKKAIINNKPHINKDGIRLFTSKLQYPIHYFDFETFMEPIPRFDGSKSYSQIPFQYSLHIQYEDRKLEHFEFLHTDSTDPRKKILSSMIEKLGDKGSIVVFNQAFEKTRLKELAALYPEHSSSISNILERIVDLLEPFSKFHYYSPLQNGSCSIKKVLPAVTGKSYEGMDIANGGDASTLYFKATFGNDFDEDDKVKIYSDLLKYCKLDTEGMVWIINELKRIVNE